MNKLCLVDCARFSLCLHSLFKHIDPRIQTSRIPILVCFYFEMEPSSSTSRHHHHRSSSKHMSKNKVDEEPDDFQFNYQSYSKTILARIHEQKEYTLLKNTETTAKDGLASITNVKKYNYSLKYRAQAIQEKLQTQKLEKQFYESIDPLSMMFQSVFRCFVNFYLFVVEENQQPVEAVSDNVIKSKPVEVKKKNDDDDFFLDNLNEFINSNVLPLLDKKSVSKPVDKVVYSIEDTPQGLCNLSKLNISHDDSNQVKPRKFFRPREERQEENPSKSDPFAMSFSDFEDSPVKKVSSDVGIAKVVPDEPITTNAPPVPVISSSDFGPNEETSSVNLIEQSDYSICLNDTSNKINGKSNKRQKTQNNNYKRLTMKKKINFKNKKFNNKQYKYKAWKQNKKTKKEDAVCYNCGVQGHYSSECSSTNQFGKNALEEASQELENNIDVSLEDIQLPLDSEWRPLFNDVDDPELEQCVQNALVHFGHSDIKPFQKTTIKRILCGQSTLCIAPTGSGKSLCYQMAAYCLSSKLQLLTLVVSPLISLMEDQIANIPKCIRAASLNSTQGEKERKQTMELVVQGDVDVLFLSPEFINNSLNSKNFIDIFSRVGFVCFDEAHCLVEWSSNFRPAYLQTWQIMKRKMNIKVVLAMTATATKQVQKIISQNLNLDPSRDIVGHTRIPVNLVLSVSKEREKMPALVQLLQREPFHSLKSIIIYCTKRDQSEKLATFLRISLQYKTEKDANYVARAYHAGISSHERKRTQTDFIKGKLRIVVATIAFGLGIDKRDITGIIHYDMPKSFENYIQEIGRAGRGGMQAHCHLFLDTSGEDLYYLQKYIYANSTDRATLRKLIMKIYRPCKCKFLAEQTSRSQVECPKHLVALPVTETEIDVDIKNENIYTLLLHLERDYGLYPIQTLPFSNSYCKIINFGETSDIAALIAKSRVLQLGLFLAKRDNRNEQLDLSEFEFSISQVASLMGKSTGEIKKELKSFEWSHDEVNKKWRQSCVSVRFIRYSFNLQAPGTLDPDQIEHATDFLYDIVTTKQDVELAKLRFVYSKFNTFSLQTDYASIGDQDVDLERWTQLSDGLKAFLDSYFEADNTDLLAAEPMNNLPPLYVNNNFYDQDQLVRTLKDMVNMYRDQGVYTARRMARILQGIGSPRYPAEIWAKVRQYWNVFPRIDHLVLMQACQEVLQKSYSIKRKFHDDEDEAMEF